MTKVFSLSIFGLSVLLFIGALTLPGFHVIQGSEEPKPWIVGGWLLTFGPFALLQGIVSWLANPLLFFAWFSVWRKMNGAALLFGLGALGFALSFLLYQGFRFHDGSGMNMIAGAAPGYWLWIGSIVMCIFAAAFSKFIITSDA